MDDDSTENYGTQELSDDGIVSYVIGSDKCMREAYTKEEVYGKEQTYSIDELDGRFGKLERSATTEEDGQMTAADKAKLNGIATGANKYTLPKATASTLGGIKVGTGLKVSNGILSTAYTYATVQGAVAITSTDKTACSVNISYPSGFTKYNSIILAVNCKFGSNYNRTGMAKYIANAACSTNIYCTYASIDGTKLDKATYTFTVVLMKTS